MRCPLIRYSMEDNTQMRRPEEIQANVVRMNDFLKTDRKNCVVFLRKRWICVSA